MNTNIYDKESDITPSKDTGPEAAEGADLEQKELKFDTHVDIFSKKDENLNSENINI